jgi:hypothetical protein
MHDVMMFAVGVGAIAAGLVIRNWAFGHRW